MKHIDVAVAVALVLAGCVTESPNGSSSAGGGGGQKAGSGGALVSDGASSGGVSESGGASSGVGGTISGTGGAGAGDFTLLFRDDFDGGSLDTSRWQIMTHSWPGNLAKFSSQSVTVGEGMLTATLLEANPPVMDSGESKSFYGAEVRSVDTLTYGRVRARARLASGSAVVSALVTIYTPWPADNWNELDIECLGKDPSEVQYNAMVYTGQLPAASTPVSPTQDPEILALGFDASADFHTYEIEWTPESAVFRVDGVTARVWDDRIELMTLPQNVLLTIWASGEPVWAGAVDGTTTGAKIEYDWVELYEYSGQ